MVQAQDRLQAQGAKVISKLRILESGTSLLSPGLIDVTGLELADEEHFGPLLKVVRYSNWDAAIAEANNIRYGLAAGLHCVDAAQSMHGIDSLRCSPGREQPETRYVQTSGCFNPFLPVLLSAATRG